MHGRSRSRTRLLAAALALVVTLLAAPATAHAGGSPPSEIGTAARFAVSPPLRSLRPLPPQAAEQAFPARRRIGATLGDIAPAPRDRARQAQTGAGPALTAGAGWDGVPNVDGVVPPDTNGDVGPNDYVQWVNLSFQIFSKTGTSLYGPAAGNTLWQALGGTCAQFNQGDPVVLYDRMADRWVFGQFGFATTRGGSPKAPYYECVAVSQTSDPTGAYNLYAFNINPASSFFPDYPKLGIWPDGYYLSTNNFNGNTFAGAGAYVLDRSKMLAGDPSAGVVGFQLPSQYEGLLPSTLEGAALPPAGSPDYFGSVDTSSTGGTGSTFQIWKLHADWATPANTTFTGPASVPVDPYTFSFCGQAYSSACIAQPGTRQTLDPLSDRLMNRLEYRNFGDHESLVADHTVNVGVNGGDRAGVRWYEIRSPGGSPFVQQQGTYAPNDGVNRWMGSVAMDGAGDIAIGYSASGSSTYPGVRYTLHAASDPAGVAGQAEQTMVAGAGSQTGYPRWGDYSAMAVDPVDDSTFWYTQEYYSASSSFGWRTRIGSFRLGAAPPTVTMTAPAAGSATNDSTPTFAGTAGTALGDGTTVTVNVFAGTSATGSNVQSDSAVVMAGGTWSVSASPALPDGTYTAQASQTGTAGTGYSSPVTFTVDTVAPATPVITSPADGTLTASNTVTLTGTAEARSTVTVYDGTSAKGTTTASNSGAWSKTLTAVPDGSHTYTAKATDAAGNTSPASAPVTVTVQAPPANIAPVAAFTFSPPAPLAGTAVAFDGSGSTDADGAVAAWAWAFGDGATAAGPAVSHAYALPGSYTVQLTVTDDRGATGALARTLTVAAAGPPQQQQPQQPQQPAVPPQAALRIPRQRLATVLRRGLRLSVRSTARGDATVTITRGRRSAGRATAALDGVRWSALRIRLSASARRALRTARRTRLTVSVAFRSTTGTRIALRQGITLRR